MDGRKMATVPFKLWEDIKRWKEEQIQKPRLPPDPNVSDTASLQRDLSSSWPMKICLKLKNLNCMARPCTNLKRLVKKL